MRSVFKNKNDLSVGSFVNLPRTGCWAWPQWPRWRRRPRGRWQSGTSSWSCSGCCLSFRRNCSDECHLKIPPFIQKSSALSNIWVRLMLTLLQVMSISGGIWCPLDLCLSLACSASKGSIGSRAAVGMMQGRQGILCFISKWSSFCWRQGAGV